MSESVVHYSGFTVDRRMISWISLQISFMQTFAVWWPHTEQSNAQKLYYQYINSHYLFSVCKSPSQVTWLSSVLRPLRHSIGYMGDGFYRSKDPTNSIKVLKEKAAKENNTKKHKENRKYTHTQNSIQITVTQINTASPLVYNNMGWLGDSSHRGQVR